MSSSEKSPLGSNVISLPKGGGAVAGMGESFSPDLFTGTGNFSVPIAVPPGRNGLQPSLTLGYSTGSGNGPFGLGWNMSLPGVARKTNLGIPRYDDEKDVFVLSGAEDLIPVDRGTGSASGITHSWMRYQPRTEGLFARITHHIYSDGRNFWEVRTKDGMVTWYGNPEATGDTNTTLFDPENPRHIAQWSIYRTADPFGNEVIYEYDRDLFLPAASAASSSPSAFPATSATSAPLRDAFAQLYLARIKYADYSHENIKRHLSSVSLDYSSRPDPHSEFRQGFEIRTTRRCTRINTFTHPLDADMPTGHTPSGNDDNTVAVKSYVLTYRDELGHEAHNKVSQLSQVQATGHDRASDGTPITESLPPVEFEYQDVTIGKRNLIPIAGEHLPALGLNHPDMDLVDLDGNGLPDFVQMSAGQPIRYWKNKGNGEFALPRTMRNAPTGLALGSGAVQLMDADGDGRVDLVMNAPNFSGYYSLNHDGEWDSDSFRKYDTRPPVNLQSAQAQFIDLSGDGRTDVLINADRFICYFQNSPLLDTNRNFDGLQFENRAIGWSEARFVNKAGLDDFPNVNFGDPRIRTADMSGDGLADIVQVQDGNICFWPNLGYGRFGKRRQMRNSPRIGHGFNPAQLILGDADGDGLTDVIYVDRNSITLWINQSGNGFSAPITIEGTPSFSNRDSVRMVDLFGTGTPGILWSYELRAPNAPLGGMPDGSQARMLYLDLTGSIKPYVMLGMRNNLGARTRVQYGTSTAHYIRDTYGRPTGADTAGDYTGYAGKWKTTLPFPVQVVDRVEVIDEISKGKLTTRYFYHHGYWDGGEREFRGFGRVDQFDTETFDHYNNESLFDGVSSSLSLGEGGGGALGVSLEHYAPPVLAKNWFHLGPVGAEKGDWKEVDFSEEYWSEDANMLERDPAMLQMIAGLPRRARRDAFRTLRGTALRSELYAMDGSVAQQRPYTVSETQTGLRLVDSPNTNPTIKALAVQTHSNHIFFSFGLSSRSTTWERGNDPMTKFSFTGAIDNYGQPLSQISIAVPRGKDPRTGAALAGTGGEFAAPGDGYLATIQYTAYIYIDPAFGTGGEFPAPGSPADACPPAFDGQYVVDRTKQARSYEAENNGSMSVFALRDDLLKPRDEWSLATPHLLALGYTYYDGTDQEGDDYGLLGAYGVPVRTEALMVQPEELDAVYGNATGAHPAPFYNTGSAPDWSGHPTDFVNALQHERAGYVKHTAGGPEDYVAGYYTSAQRTRFDFHVDAPTAKGLPLNMWDVFDNKATIEYDSYQLLPVLVTDPLEMQTSADYDYRVMQPHRVTDANQNSSAFAFTPLGLMHKTALLGKDDASEGDTLDVPGVLLEYDLFAFSNNGEPVWVKTTQRVHHINADYLSTLPTEEQSATIVAVEYSDGFGRQLQTRTQAEDMLFLEDDAPETGALGSSRLPADQEDDNENAVGTLGADNVVVSGAKRYNNKGKVVEQWEPYFATGWLCHSGLDPESPDLRPGQRVRIYYDALGRPQRTLNPDGTEQRVVYGVPNALNTPGSFKASPWERYSYDANDLAPLTHPSDTSVPSAHHWTPKSEVIDALGRTVKTTEHNAHYDADEEEYQSVVMRYAYDIKGQLLVVTDPLNRACFTHKYDTAGNNLWTEHLDSGEKKLVVDAQGKPLYSSDAKGAAVYTAYDELQRPTNIWAKDAAAEDVTLRQRLIYGDSGGLATPQFSNHNGKLYEHYDEAGYVQLREYDFKGNPLRKLRRVIADEELTGTEKYVVDWDVLTLNHHQVDDRSYITDLLYDGLNRVRKSTLPEDVETERKELVPTYNRAGALQAVTFNGTDYVRHIAYNAKGQRVLLAMGNDMMTRYAYDALTYRLMRTRSEAYTEADDEYTPDGNVQQDLAYLYDLVGNIVSIRDKAPANSSAEGPGNLLKQFAYDPLNRLLSATGRESTQAPVLPEWDTSIRNHDHTATNTYTRAYQFDKLGNVLQEQHTADGNVSNSFTKTFQYHATQEHNKLLSFTVGGTTYDQSYDANGNLIGDDTSRVYAWGYDDKLRFFSLVPGPSSSKIAHYLYDASGTRVKKVVNKPSGKQEVTVYIDGVYEHTYTKDSGTLDTTRNYNTLHVLDGTSRIASVQVGADADEPSGYPPVRYNVEDHLGNSCVELDSNGALINREEYYPFGDTCFGAFAKKRYRYNGKEKDNESGLYNYGMRYYAPWMCRFVSVDPLAPEYPHYTPYQYAGNKPINFVDLDGLEENSKPSSELPSVIYTYVPPPPPPSAEVTQAEDALTKNQHEINLWSAAVEHIQHNIDHLVEFVEGLPLRQVMAGAMPAPLGEVLIIYMEEQRAAALADIDTLFNVLANDKAVLAQLEDDRIDLQEAKEQAQLAQAQNELERGGTPSTLGASAVYHGNDLRSRRIQHGYVIKNKAGAVMEYGISGQPLSHDKDGRATSPRAQSKLRIKYLGDPNYTYEVIKEGMSNRYEAVVWEAEQVDNYARSNRGQAPPEQKMPSLKTAQRIIDAAKSRTLRSLSRFGLGSNRKKL
jgi:RHS repeat-associated protein